MDDEHGLKMQMSLLKGITTGALIKELMARGALRGYGSSEYLPGVVAERFAGVEENLRTLVRAKQVDKLAQVLVDEGVIDFTERRVADTDPAAPPNDMIYEAEFLTLDPKAEMGSLG